uniref:WD and tetratricopeptide repeats protein 1 n=1 Tax=Lygus hesperus TaxID=30085 RepID=A0A0K8S7M9_LYGHE
MPRTDSVLSLVNRREVDFKVNSRLQKKLHVTTNLINRLGLEQTLYGHTGCVNCLEWDSKGRTLASASDDFHVIIWDPFTRKKLTTLHTGHHGNIFSVKFMPQTNENIIVTGAGDYEVRVHNVVCKELTRVCVCHGGRIKRIATAQDVPDIYWTAAEDGVIRQFDSRAPHTCRIEKNVLIDLKTYAGDYIEAKCLSVNPLRSELIAVGANDPYIRIYDRRMIKIIKGLSFNPTNSPNTEDNVPPGCVQYFVPGHVPSKKKCTDRELREYSATYVTFGPNGTDLLVNLGSEQIYLFDIMTKSRSLLVRHTNDNQEVSPPLKTYCDSDSFEKCTVVADAPKPYLPEHINVLKLAGNTLFEKEEYSSSIRIYNEAIGEYPKSSVMYSNRAAAYMKRDWCGDTYAALRDCITALEFDSNNIKAFFRMSRCLYELSWFEECAKLFE